MDVRYGCVGRGCAGSRPPANDWLEALDLTVSGIEEPTTIVPERMFRTRERCSTWAFQKPPQ
jgi:hypothetical protein